jgi:xanthine dehydrogenase YagS FAD-binding subunit
VPQRDTNLRHDEIIIAVELPARGFAANYTYLKIRDRLSYACARAHAVGLELDGGSIRRRLHWRRRA